MVADQWNIIRSSTGILNLIQQNNGDRLLSYSSGDGNMYNNLVYISAIQRNQL